MKSGWVLVSVCASMLSIVACGGSASGVMSRPHCGTAQAWRFHAPSEGRSTLRRAIDEECWVAISGYGPTKATVVDGGELFGRSR
jgi:hypothetical protein